MALCLQAGNSSLEFSEASKHQWALSLSEFLQPRYLLPGEYVIREGEHGDELYIIKSGKVGVEVRGTLVAYQTRGSYFGDIALVPQREED